jgi:hypothetical protein
MLICLKSQVPDTGMHACMGSRSTAEGDELQALLAELSLL